MDPRIREDDAPIRTLASQPKPMRVIANLVILKQDDAITSNYNLVAIGTRTVPKEFVKTLLATRHTRWLKHPPHFLTRVGDNHHGHIGMVSHLVADQASLHKGVGK